MDLFSALATLPLAPLRGLLALARAIQAEADRQLYDPGVARRQLEELQAAEAAGAMSPQERQEAEQQVVQRLVAQSASDPTAGDPPAGVREEGEE